MESSDPLSMESFSYRWLVNSNPARESFDRSSSRASLDTSDEAYFIEMDPRMPPSRRFSRNRGNSASQDFGFDFPGASPSSPALVHADEIFSEGYVLPLFLDPSRMKAYETSNLTPPRPGSLKLVMSSKSCSSPSSKTRCGKLSKRMFRKYMDFLRPLYRIFRAGRSSFQAEFGDARGPGMRNWVYPEEASSPRISEAYSANDGCKSFDSESSIYEAVLHCKRSFGGKIRLNLSTTESSTDTKTRGPFRRTEEVHKKRSRVRTTRASPDTKNSTTEIRKRGVKKITLWSNLFFFVIFVSAFPYVMIMYRNCRVGRGYISPTQ